MIGNFRADSGNGAVYVFNRDASGAYKVESKISPPGPITARNSGFGSSLVLRGDSAFSGAMNDRGAGAVWVFARDSRPAAGIPSRARCRRRELRMRYGISLAEVGKRAVGRSDGANGFQGRASFVTRDSTGFPTAYESGPRHHARGPNAVRCKDRGFAIARRHCHPNEDYGEGGVVLYSRRPTGAWTVAAISSATCRRCRRSRGANVSARTARSRFSTATRSI